MQVCGEKAKKAKGYAELVNGTYNAVMEVADLFRHFAAMHDEVALDAYAQEIRRIQLLEAEQGTMEGGREGWG